MARAVQASFSSEIGCRVLDCIALGNLTSLRVFTAWCYAKVVISGIPKSLGL